MDLFSLTRQLIDLPSTTGQEGAVASFLADHLTSLGYSVELQPVDGNRSNIIATTSAPPRIVFSTHMDTVPPHIPSSEDSENIYGRGSCDAKGIIAAQMFAALKLRSLGCDEVGLLFTVDEELASAGAMLANSHRLAAECRYLINGEPTDNRMATGTKGSLRFTISCAGRAAHSAYPEQGESAIEKLLDILDEIRATDWPSDEIFGETTCNIGVISGGARANVIPASAQAELQIRLVTPVARIKEIVERAVAGRGKVSYSSEHEPVRLFALDGFETCLPRFTTDIPYLSKWGTPLLIGPGSIFVAHTDHEMIAKKELIQAVDLYVRLGTTLMAELAAVAIG